MPKKPESTLLHDHIDVDQDIAPPQFHPQKPDPGVPTPPSFLHMTGADEPVVPLSRHWRGKARRRNP